MATTRSSVVSEDTTNDKDRQFQSASRKIDNKLDLLDKKMGSLYRDIYISRPDNIKNLDNIIDTIDSSIDRLQGSDTISTSNMSQLIQRLDGKNRKDSDEFLTSVSDIFNDNGLLGTLFNNQDIHKHICAENYTYDLICKYLPKLEEALEIKRDNVLCSDNFDKKFLNAEYYKSTKSEQELFSINDNKLVTKYDLNNFLEKTYWNCSKYGEDFIYIVPYNIAFQRLIKKSNERKLRGANNSLGLNQISLFGESVQVLTNKKVTITESNFINSQDYKNYLKSVSTLTENDEWDEKYKGVEVNLYFNDSGIINESVNDYAIATEAYQVAALKSLSIAHEASLEKQYETINSNGDGLTKSSKSAEGLIVPDTLRDENKIDDNFNGAVLERIPRENIVPVYIGSKCLGYYHFEFAEDPTACGFCGGHHSTPGISNATEYAYNMSDEQQELAIRYISSKIASKITTHFINANKDLKEEIYAILQYNDKFDMTRTNNVGVTFIPADDIVHCYLDLDEHTHRGISDLKKSVVPAMLYVLLYLTDIIGKVTRSTDKRIYYVKQNVETNIARTMMNVVKQIKKGNLGMRQIESMNNILNIVGRYNDYIIPLGVNGDPPIQFETMQGQDIQTPTDLMSSMEEAAVNPIVPYEFVNSVMQVDYASRFTMTNTKFMRTITKCQSRTERFFSIIYTRLYNFEYDEKNPLIKIILPPPIYLLINNNTQLLDSVSGMSDKLIDIYLPNEDDELKAKFKANYVKSKLSAYINENEISRMIEAAKVELQADIVPATDSGEENEEDYV